MFGMGGEEGGRGLKPRARAGSRIYYTYYIILLRSFSLGASSCYSYLLRVCVCVCMFWFHAFLVTYYMLLILLVSTKIPRATVLPLSVKSKF